MALSRVTVDGWRQETGALSRVTVDGWRQETVAAAGVTGTLAATETGSDTAALAGDILVQGTLAVTETGADVAAFAGSATSAPVLSAATVVSITTTTATPRVTITFA